MAQRSKKKLLKIDRAQSSLYLKFSNGMLGISPSMMMFSLMTLYEFMTVMKYFTTHSTSKEKVILQRIQEISITIF